MRGAGGYHLSRGEDSRRRVIRSSPLVKDRTDKRNLDIKIPGSTERTGENPDSPLPLLPPAGRKAGGKEGHRRTYPAGGNPAAVHILRIIIPDNPLEFPFQLPEQGKKDAGSIVAVIWIRDGGVRRIRSGHMIDHHLPGGRLIVTREKCRWYGCYPAPAPCKHYISSTPHKQV